MAFRNENILGYVLIIFILLLLFDYDENDSFH